MERGMQFGNGTGLPGTSDKGNSYDNAMIKRGAEWASKNYNAVQLPKANPRQVNPSYRIESNGYPSTDLSKIQ